MKITLESTRAFVEHNQKLRELEEYLEYAVAWIPDEAAMKRLMDAQEDVRSEKKRLTQNFINQFLVPATGFLK